MNRVQSIIIWLFILLMPAMAMAASETDAIKEIIGKGDQEMMAGAQLIYDSREAGADKAALLESRAADKFDRGFARYAKALASLKSPKINHYDRLNMTWPIYYNMAAARSLQNRKEEAIDYMGRMMSAGFDLWLQLNREHDFDNIRNEPGYKRIVSLAKDAEMVRRYFADWLLKEEALFPFDPKLITLEGKPLSLSSLKGKVVIVNFWGTWYEPWETEPQILNAIEQSFDGRVVVIGLAWQKGMAVNDAKASLAKAAKQIGINYPLAMVDKEMTASVPEFLTWPTTLFIDKKGRVRYKSDGALDHASHWMLIRLLDAESP